MALAVHSGEPVSDRGGTGSPVGVQLRADPLASSSALASVSRATVSSPLLPPPLCPSDPPAPQSFSLSNPPTVTEPPPLSVEATARRDDKLEAGHERTQVVRDKHSLDYIARSLVAGGVAGSVAKSVIAPLDRVKILFQTGNARFQRHAGTFTGSLYAMREIYQENGLRGLFQGHTATLLRIFPYAAIKFMAFEQYKHWLMPTHADETGLRHLAAGSLAGVTSVYFTYPLELVRVRMAFSTGQRKVGILRTMHSIYTEPNTVIATYSPAYRNFLVAEASGTLAHSAHLSTSGGAVAAVHTRTLSFPTLIRPVAGIYNFYRGFLPTVYGMIPYAGISFWTYEMVGQVLRNRFARWSLASGEEAARLAERAKKRGKGSPGKAPLSTAAQLAAGALAGAVAQTCSYPLEVIRRRMQVAGSSELNEIKTQLAAGTRSGLDDISHKTTFGTARDIFARRGFKGFFVGLSIGYIKVTPMVAVSFVVYEKMKVLLDID